MPTLWLLPTFPLIPCRATCCHLVVTLLTLCCLSAVSLLSLCCLSAVSLLSLCCPPAATPLPRAHLGVQRLLNEATSTRQSTPVAERSIAWNRLKEETDLKRIVSGARKWYAAEVDWGRAVVMLGASHSVSCWCGGKSLSQHA